MHEISHTTLDTYCLLQQERNFCVGASASEPLILCSLSWTSLISLSVLQTKSFQSSTAFYRRDKTEICMNVGHVCFYRLKLIQVIKYFLQCCSRIRIVSVKFIYDRTKDFEFSDQYTVASNEVPQRLITEVGGNGVFGLLFIRSCFVDSDFTLILSRFGDMWL
jgi:hypothetical protein